MINKNNRQKEYIRINNNLNEVSEYLNKLELQLFYNSKEIKKLSKILKEEIQSISKSIEELKNPFLLFIVGPGKYGKTTLINSLIKENLLEINDIPNTWKLDVLSKSETERIEIYYNTNKYLNLSYKNGMNILKEEEKKFKDSKGLIKKKFNDYKKSSNKNVNELKQYKSNLEDNYLYKSDIEEVRYYINKNEILEDFIIVDTPGLNQTLKNNTKKRMFDYYKRADGVIWILDAQNIVAKCNNDLIKELKSDYMIDEDFNNIICVVNKIDILKEEDKEKVRLKVNDLYKNYFKDIILISSKEALNGYINNDIKYIESSNIKTLNSSIDKNFKRYSEKIQIESKQNLLKLSSNTMNKYISSYKRKLYKDIHKYEEAKIALEEAIVNLECELGLNIKRYLSINNVKEKSLKSELRILEENINREINKLYFSMVNISIIDKDKNIDFIEDKNIDINISKSKDLFKIHRYIDKLEIERLQKNNLENIYNQLISQQSQNDKEWILRFQLDRFSKKITEIVSSKLLEIKSDIDYIREVSFRNKYTDYSLIQEHLIIINRVSNYIKLWG